MYATGANIKNRFRPDEKVEYVHLDNPEPYQLLYTEGDNLCLMHVETFEQTELPTGTIDAAQQPFLADGMTLKVLTYQGQTLGIMLPATVELEVMETGRELGTGAGAVRKSAVLENGVTTTVPGFVDPGMVVVVSTEDGAYVKRA